MQFVLVSGYMTRQALYACLTCTVPRSPDFSPAGICLACSYNCHEGHELVSILYETFEIRLRIQNSTSYSNFECIQSLQDHFSSKIVGIDFDSL